MLIQRDPARTQRLVSTQYKLANLLDRDVPLAEVRDAVAGLNLASKDAERLVGFAEGYYTASRYRR